MPEAQNHNYRTFGFLLQRRRKCCTKTSILEVTEGAQKLECRLKDLEKNIQIIVDATVKNEKRRAKQTFDKAFSTSVSPGFSA